MTIYWENIWGNFITMGENSTWKLYPDLNDDQSDAYIYLEIDGRRYETLWSDELTLGTKDSKLNCYEVIELYSAVVRKAYELIKSEKVPFLDLTDIQNQLLGEFWQSWRSRGIVTGEHG